MSGDIKVHDAFLLYWCLLYPPVFIFPSTLLIMYALHVDAVVMLLISISYYQCNITKMVDMVWDDSFDLSSPRLFEI